MHEPQAGDARSRWNARYSSGEAVAGTPAPFLSAIEMHVPTSGSALDVGGGLGTNATWLAERGLSVTLLDVSDEALARAAWLVPDGCQVDYMRRDAEVDGLAPGSRYDFVLMHLFLARSVVSGINDHLTDGGVLAVCQPTVLNLERHPRPPARFLWEEGEVVETGARIQKAGWAEVLEASEAWRQSGRHDGWLVLRRRPA